ncbi:MAG: hypothetical protein QN155_07405 [Armatimonadota bacterium]|nr:hypothetical protein [Armatimonadota bacterium]
MREFTLHVRPAPDGHFGVEVRQRTNGARGLEERTLVRLWGTPFWAAVSQVLDALKRSGYRPGDLHRGRKAPFTLREECGVRVALLFMALKPLRKTTRMEAIATAIAAMSDEECYYWFSKCVKAERPHAAQKALRILADSGG